MSKRWSQVVRSVLHRGRHVLPVVVSAGLLTWVVWKITPQKLLHALSAVNWPLLLLLTLAQLVVLFLWDALSLWWLFSRPDKDLPFRSVLRARADSSVWTAVNVEIGQGVMAAELARAGYVSVAAVASRTILAALVDFSCLLTLGLVGWFLRPDPRVAWIEWVCVVGLAVLGALAGAVWLLPRRWKQWLIHKHWMEWLAWWRWRHSLLLWGQRLVLFVLVLVYAGLGLAVCGVHVTARLVLGVIPFALVSEAIPSSGGLGTREAALLLLLNPTGGERAAVIGFSLIWTVVVMLGRIVIGLASHFLPRWKGSA
ncbi:MAG TPA: lysylphosphatidylglycerol synthase transmembrane domain-containing protein [Gemmataceae bacterium]|nr:lysylphosphatidylglycerol synthase transmembrane domain-containing protein [Gemmataceae bacterium]